MNGPIFLLAPHASHPPMDGASYRSWSLAGEFARSAECYYFAKEKFLRLRPDGTVEEIDSVRSRHGKNWSALRTVVFRSHYLVEKHLPKAWVRKVDHWLGQVEPGMLYISFLWAWTPRWAASRHIPIFVDTHNYDPEWWENLKRSNNNWISQRVCDLSLAYALKSLSEITPNATMIHVSASDCERYTKLRPDLRHIVMQNGCELEFRAKSPDYAMARKRLYFLGALNLQITLDSLRYFAERFWPALEEIAEMHVFGSGESPQVEELCKAHGWIIHKSLSDEELTREFEHMHYMVLPFSYSAGIKLKLINACGRGMPILSTSHGVYGFDQVPPTVFVSEEPADWAERVRSGLAPSEADLLECRRFAELASWPRRVAIAGLLDAYRHE